MILKLFSTDRLHNHRRWSPVSANTGRFNLWWGVFFMSFAHVSTGVLIFYLIYMSSLCTKDNTSPRYCWQSRVSSFWWNDQTQHHLHKFTYLKVTMASPVTQLVKESACNAGHLGSIPGLGRSPGEGKGYPLQYSGLDNSHGIAKCWTWLRDFHSHFHKLQKELGGARIQHKEIRSILQKRWGVDKFPVFPQIISWSTQLQKINLCLGVASCPGKINCPSSKTSFSAEAFLHLVWSELKAPY